MHFTGRTKVFQTSGLGVLYRTKLTKILTSSEKESCFPLYPDSVYSLHVCLTNDAEWQIEKNAFLWPPINLVSTLQPECSFWNVNLIVMSSRLPSTLNSFHCFSIIFSIKTKILNTVLEGPTGPGPTALKVPHSRAFP